MLCNEEFVIQVPRLCAGLQSARLVRSDPSSQKGHTEIYDICKNIYCFWSTALASVTKDVFETHTEVCWYLPRTCRFTATPETSM